MFKALIPQIAVLKIVCDGLHGVYFASYEQLAARFDLLICAIVGSLVSIRRALW